ncbi:MAG TPA: hypothetical protein VHE55_16600 [Fimbriimonadaceae bacterium]|nr:hypothetical protein [Fimbriimonadaceae bacterium]
MTIKVSFYVDYVKDSPNDPDAPDTAGGLASVTESSMSSYTPNGPSYASVSGSGFASCSGQSQGIVNTLNFAASATQSDPFNYGSPTSSGPTSGSEALAFIKNTGSESGTHVAFLAIAGPSGNVSANATADSESSALAYSGVYMSGSLALATINGLPVY